MPTTPQEELDDLYKTLDDELEHNTKQFEKVTRPRIEKAKAIMGDFYSPGEHYVDALLRYVEHLTLAVADAEVLLAGRGLTDRATPEEKAALERFRNRGKAPTP